MSTVESGFVALHEEECIMIKDQLQNKFSILLGLDWQVQIVSVGFANPTGASFGEVISSTILSTSSNTVSYELKGEDVYYEREH